MKTLSANPVSRLLSPFRLAGPLFDKELRVSSRRRRNYALRFVYVLLLTFFVAGVWLNVVESQYSALYQKSRMALAGKTIITTIVTFQFIATQLIAVVMLSTAISDEIHHRTLGLLMTTPISSFHVVVGKLFSKLLQIILLLAISTPLLAVVRVFGGVPAGYLLSSLCITLTAVIFAGSLSLLFSISNRRAYVVIIKTWATLAGLYVAMPMIAATWLYPQLAPRFTFTNLGPAGRDFSIFLHLNPVGAMSMNTATMMSPTMPVAMPWFSWPLHCLLMLAISAVIIAWSVRVVRRVALRQATGQIDLLPKRGARRRKTKRSAPAVVQERKQWGAVRRVKGSPVLWKEIRAPMIRGIDSRNSIIGLVVTIIALLITYGICHKENCLDEGFAHVTYVLMFMIVGSIFTMVLSATCITSEKESSAWPIMLATSMDDWEILAGKAAGVFRRCLPIWLLLAGHVLFFVCLRYIHPIAIIHLFIFLVGLVSFLTGVGLYYSSRFKRTTAAVVSTFALALAVWVFIPAMLGTMSLVRQDRDIREISEAYFASNPATQTVVVMNGSGGDRVARARLSSLRYGWPVRKASWQKVWPTTRVLSFYMLVYVSAGLLFAWRAKCRFRRNIF